MTWTKTLQKIPRKINASLSSAKRKLAEKNEWNSSNQSDEVFHIPHKLQEKLLFSVTFHLPFFSYLI